MQSISFTCEVITPMFLSGADGQTPELRAPSIKGALRFWWRAVNGHLSLDKLKEYEGEIFGSTNAKSKLLLNAKILSSEIDNNAFLVPHKGMKGRAFKSKTKFEVTISLNENSKKLPISFEQVQALFEITCLLGGNGKRVRRGMGSYRILQSQKNENVPAKYTQPSNLDDIYRILAKLSPYYTISGNNIYNTFAGNMELYPWIKQIEVGKNVVIRENDLTKKISDATHTVHGRNKTNEPAYESSLGHAKGGRFASPVYVSIIKTAEGFIPIITTLNTCPNRNINQIDKSIQDHFKTEILSKNH